MWLSITTRYVDEADYHSCTVNFPLLLNHWALYMYMYTEMPYKSIGYYEFKVQQPELACIEQYVGDCVCFMEKASCYGMWLCFMEDECYMTNCNVDKFKATNEGAT